MFGRRNPDRIPVPPPQPTEDDLDLDVLSDLPDIPPLNGRPAQPTQPLSEILAMTQEHEVIVQRETAPIIIPPFSEPVPAENNTSYVPTPSAPVSNARPGSESVIGPDDFFDGNYRSERGVRIQGKVRGSIESHQYIYVEASAQVEATLSAEDITIAGAFHGEIECRHRLEVTGTGKIRGGVKTALLVVQEGGSIDGQLEMASARES